MDNIDHCIDYNVSNEYKYYALDTVKNIQKNSSIPHSCAAINISGSLNIGMMIRTAVIFGIEKFYIIGKKKYDKRSTVGAHNYIDIVKLDVDPFVSPQAILDRLYNVGYIPTIIEQGGTNINSTNFYHHYLNRCFVFGSESQGVPDVFKKEDIYSIEQRGVLRSLNVSAACAIVLNKLNEDYRYYQKGMIDAQQEQLSRQ